MATTAEPTGITTKMFPMNLDMDLSYTTFEYSNFTISKTSITPNDKITVSVDVKNTGTVDGDEVVQVYVKTPDSPASLERPIKRLKGFKRVTIPAGQVKTVSIDIDCAGPLVLGYQKKEKSLSTRAGMFLKSEHLQETSGDRWKPE